MGPVLRRLGTMFVAQGSGALVVFFAGWMFDDPAPAWALMLGALVVAGWAIRNCGRAR